MTTQTPRGDTRARIIDVALELFAEHGYEKTSLREIADRLGVTKAALYYHFRTKEDILAGIVDTMSAPIDEAIAWGLDQPYSPALRDEILRRFAEGMSDRQRLLRFFHENQPTIRELSVGTRFKERMIALTQLLQGPDPSFEDRVRAAMSLMVINVTHFVAEACSTESQNSIELPTPEERQEIALRVALDVAETIGKEAQPVGGEGLGGGQDAAGVGVGPGRAGFELEGHGALLFERRERSALQTFQRCTAAAAMGTGAGPGVGQLTGGAGPGRGRAGVGPWSGRGRGGQCAAGLPMTSATSSATRRAISWRCSGPGRSTLFCESVEHASVTK